MRVGIMVKQIKLKYAKVRGSTLGIWFKLYLTPFYHSIGIHTQRRFQSEVRPFKFFTHLSSYISFLLVILQWILYTPYVKWVQVLIVPINYHKSRFLCQMQV